MTKSYRLQLDDETSARLEAQAAKEERRPTPMARILLRRALDAAEAKKEPT